MMLETLRHDADDGVRLIVECDATADDVLVTTEVFLPAAIANDRYGIGAGPIVIIDKVSTQQRHDAHDLEVAGADHSRVERLRAVSSGEVHRPTAKGRHRF